MFRLLLMLASISSAHFLVRYPAWRGNTLPTQFTFPCGGLPRSTNRSAWPVNGGAMSILPLQHPFAFTEVNIALGNNINETGPDKALNNPFSRVLVPMFNMTGWNETYCIPMVPIPRDMTHEVKDGVNATIQVIQLTPTGASLYNCLDITFSDTEADRFANPKIWDQFCYNGTGMAGFKLGEIGSSVNNTVVASGAILKPRAAMLWTALIGLVGMEML